MSEIVVPVAEVRAALALALDAFEQEHGPVVRTDRLLYRVVPADAAFDLELDPTTTVGSLQDDLDSVRTMAAEGDASPAWHALAHAAGLLRALERAALP